MSENKQHSFQIGQIIYLLSEEAEAIVPAIVIEEQTIRKLDGHQVSWKVAVGPPNKRKEVDSNNLKGELHTSLDDIRTIMSERLNNFVNGLIDGAKKRTEVWYGQHIVEQTKEDGSGGKIDPAALMNSIDGNGTDGSESVFLPKGKSQPQQTQNVHTETYKVKAPRPTGPLRGSSNSSGGSFKPDVKLDPNDPKSALRQQLLDMAMPTDEEMTHEGVNNQEYVVTEDGRKVPVKFNMNE